MDRGLGYYIPNKTDPIDCKLAEYINNAVDRPALRNLFERDVYQATQGVYFFGSKKCNIKLENGSLKVRVGGGYLSIQEFVD